MLKESDNSIAFMSASSPGSSSVSARGGVKESSGHIVATPTMDLRSLEADALGWLNRQGYSTMPPDGLVSPAFPDSFVPSAFHARVVRGVNEDCTKAGKQLQAGCEWVYRHVDQGKVGVSPFHLSSFKMLVYFGIYPRGRDGYGLRRTAISTFVELIKRYGLDISRCLVTYFGGGVVGGHNLYMDSEAVDLWIEAGVPSQNLIPVSGGSNFTNITRVGEPAGPRCEVFWPTKMGYVEIGTVVFERYVLGAGEIGLNDSSSLVYGGALGLERLLMASYNYENIFTLPELRVLEEIAVKDTDPRLFPLVRSHVFTLLDATRTLTLLWEATGGRPEGKRRERLRSLRTSIKRSLQSSGILYGKEVLEQLIGVVLQRDLSSGLIKPADILEFILTTDRPTFQRKNTSHRSPAK